MRALIHIILQAETLSSTRVVASVLADRLPASPCEQCAVCVMAGVARHSSRKECRFRGVSLHSLSSLYFAPDLSLSLSLSCPLSLPLLSFSLSSFSFSLFSLSLSLSFLSLSLSSLSYPISLRSLSLSPIFLSLYFPYSGDLIVIHVQQHSMPKAHCGLLVKGYSLISAGTASA